MYKVWAWVNWMENLYAAWCTWKKDGLTFRRRAQNTDLTTSKTKTFILNEIEIHFLMKDNIFHIIICNSNYISMHKKNTRPPDLFGIKFTGPKLKSLASGLRSSVKFEPCKCQWKQWQASQNPFFTSPQGDKKNGSSLQWIIKDSKQAKRFLLQFKDGVALERANWSIQLIFVTICYKINMVTR